MNTFSLEIYVETFNCENSKKKDEKKSEK